MLLRLRRKDINMMERGFSCKIRRSWPFSDIEIWLDKTDNT